ncbi:MAG: prepilin-type N-terminal cleavage/methylation domain-containing protein [Pseudomonadota bacterium]
MMTQSKIINKKNNEGFTLVELLIALAISACVMTAICSIYVSSDKVYTAQNQVAQAQQDARAGLDILGREIRMAGFIRDTINTDAGLPVSDGNNEEIEDAQATTITFEADTDNDGVTEAVCYAYNPGTREITRQEWSWNVAGWQEWNDGAGNPLGAVALIPNVTACTFVYDTDADPTNGTLATPLTAADRATVRVVTINIEVRTARPDPSFVNRDATSAMFNTNFRTRTLQSRFFVRNMGL